MRSGPEADPRSSVRVRTRRLHYAARSARLRLVPEQARFLRGHARARPSPSTAIAVPLLVPGQARFLPADAWVVLECFPKGRAPRSHHGSAARCGSATAAARLFVNATCGTRRRRERRRRTPDCRPAGSGSVKASDRAIRGPGLRTSRTDKPSRQDTERPNDEIQSQNNNSHGKWHSINGTTRTPQGPRHWR